MVPTLFALRLLVVHFLYIIYSLFLWVGVWRQAEEFDYKRLPTLATLITWFYVYGVINIFLILTAFKQER